MLKQKLLETIRQEIKETLGSSDDVWKEKAIRSRCRHILHNRSLALDSKELESLEDLVVFHFCGFGPFEYFLRDPEVSEIMVNGFKDVFLEKEGKILSIESPFESNEEIITLLQRMVGPRGKRLDLQNPMVDVRLSNGERLNAIIAPLSLQGPVVSIRKAPNNYWLLDHLVEKKTIDAFGKKIIQQLVNGRKNIVIAGGTGSGKTSTMNALASAIPENERIITIEDTAEIKMNRPHHVALETRAANAEGLGEISIRDLLRNTLRMRPDRIIVGEVRGEEVLDMFQAMNTGHQGSLTTVHASSSLETLLRLENMALLSSQKLPIEAVRPQIIQAIDIIIHQERDALGQRRILSIDEVVKSLSHYQIKSLYRYNEAVKSWEKGENINTFFPS